MYRILCILVAIIAFSSCNNKKGQSTDTGSITSGDSALIQIKYAKGLAISYHGNYRLVDISDPEGKNETVYHYALIAKGQQAEDIPKEYTIIETPVEKVICMTTLQLSNFIKLDALDKVTGMPSTHYLFNEQMKKRIEEGKTARIGIEGNFDNELVLALAPDLILVSPFKRGGYESIRDLDVPLVSFLGYKETTPLGQAEWIKFTAMLLGMEDKANTLFDAIEKRYNELVALTASVSVKPVVLSGEMRSGNWYVVGGKSYLAQQFRDAGAEYFLKDNDETGGINMDFESVYSRGGNAGYWRLLVSHTGDYSYDALQQSDARYADFKAFKEKKVVYCNLRQKPFYENTPVEPEVVLADLIKAFYPGLLPDYQPVYYEMLK
ncbi:MAG: ABC transporter substrate-binding protein [Prevotella sp.]|nr:ABC transporter substrate-binding protein [Prevotella sp.]